MAPLFFNYVLPFACHLFFPASAFRFPVFLPLSGGVGGPIFHNADGRTIGGGRGHRPFGLLACRILPAHEWRHPRPAFGMNLSSDHSLWDRCRDESTQVVSLPTVRVSLGKHDSPNDVRPDQNSDSIDGFAGRIWTRRVYRLEVCKEKTDRRLE
jgi:hypothetical protein